MPTKKRQTNRILLGYRLLPNIVTITALSMGMTAVRMAIAGRFQTAVLLVLFAAFLDAIDGALARLLKATSDLGAQLDSFSDFVSFGVAPSLILYLWSLNSIGGLGWVASLLLCIAVALRLARFNVQAFDISSKPVEKPVKMEYFEGVPAPAGAILSLVPLFIALEFKENMIPNAIVGVWVLVIGLLMISRLKTLSLKKVRIEQKYIVPALGLTALLIASVVTEPWMALTGIALAYLVSIGFTHRIFKAIDLYQKKK